MHRYVTIITIFLMSYCACAPPPLHFTIDCGSDENYLPMVRSSSSELFESSHFDVDSFCALIHRAIPKAVKDGRFIPFEDKYDQAVQADTQALSITSPPKGFLPKLSSQFKLKAPKLGIPKINVPKLKSVHKLSPTPRISSTMKISPLKVKANEESSAEKMEKFKKGVQKLLHVVKVLGQIDQYLSDRTRIIVDKLSKTFGE